MPADSLLFQEHFQIMKIKKMGGYSEAFSERSIIREGFFIFVMKFLCVIQKIVINICDSLCQIKYQQKVYCNITVKMI